MKDVQQNYRKVIWTELDHVKEAAKLDLVMEVHGKEDHVKEAIVLDLVMEVPGPELLVVGSYCVALGAVHDLVAGVMVYDLVEEVRNCTQVNTWMEQYNVVMYLDTMASISLRVRIYVVDNGQNSNVVVNLVTMASLYKRVRVYMVDMWKYNVVEYKMDGDMMLQVYNLVRGTEVDVLKQYNVVDVYYSLVRGTRTGFILGNVRMYHKLCKGDYS